MRELLEEGLSQKQIAERLGLVKSTVAYHARRLGREPDQRYNRRYDWVEVQRYYDDGHTVRECRAHFGFSTETWNSAVKRGAVVARPRGMPIEELLAAPRGREHLKLRLFRAGLKQPHCEVCGIASWMGEPLSMCLHHVNGDNQDNRLDNLQILCPNCHAQTENFSGRNRGKGARLRAV